MKLRETSLRGTEMSDEELAAEAQAGSRRCFEELVHRYTHRLYYFLRPKLSTGQDTEDLVQETFLKTYRNIGRFDSTYKFSTWIYTTATRLLISFYRKRQVSEPVCGHNTSAPDPQDQAIEAEKVSDLWKSARGLNPHQFQVLWLRYQEDLPLKEIARVMKKNQVHIRVLLHRARANLIKQLNPAVSSPGTERRPAHMNVLL
jgi:RNA polymerase sigma-70 factor, ECF subfamily